MGKLNWLLIRMEGSKFSRVPVGERGLGEAIGIDVFLVNTFSSEEFSLEHSFCLFSTVLRCSSSGVLVLDRYPKSGGAGR